MQTKLVIAFVAMLLQATTPSAHATVATASGVTTSTDDAVLRLALDEGKGQLARDDSGHGNDGVLKGSPAYIADTKDGSAHALRFDGADDYIDLGAVDVKGSGLTIAAWFKADTFPGRYRDPRILSKASGTAANDHVFMLSTIKSGRATVLRARVRVAGVTSTLIASRGQLKTGVWQHGAATYDGKTLRLYLDGVEVGSKSLSGKIDTDPNLRVAAGSQPGGRSRLFDGLLDDIRVLERALEPAELQALVAGNPAKTPTNHDQTTESVYAPAPSPGSLLNLSLDEGSGSSALDGSGLSNNARLIGGPTYMADSGDGSPYALRLDGVDDYIDLGKLDVVGSGLTMAAWFKADTYPGRYRDPRILSKASGTAANDHVFMLSTIKSGSGTVLRTRVRVAGNTSTLIASSGHLKTGVWQHGAATYDGKTLRLYLNGVEVGRKSLSGKIDIDPDLRIAAGSQPGGKTRLFDGALDDVRILERAMSPAELRALAAGKPAPATIEESHEMIASVQPPPAEPVTADKPSPELAATTDPASNTASEPGTSPEPAHDPDSTTESNQSAGAELSVEQAPAPVSKSITLSWQIPTDRADGSYLSLGEIDGFEIYYTAENSGESTTVTVAGNQVDRYQLTDLPADIFHISMATVDNKDIRSELSDMVTVDLR